jgi:proline iminopeptidase
MSHDYLRPFEDLAPLGYRVVWYDQLGCGRSELARDPVEYTVERDVADADLVRRGLGLGPVHLIGSSYGGLLAIAYALAHPEGLRTLVSASGLADVPLTVREMQRLVSELPEPQARAIRDHERKGEFQHPDYLRAVDAFYRRHLCRLDPWPAEVTYTLDHVSLPKYGRMNGPNEFTIVGTIRDWDQSARLGEIRTPTLLTTGRYDEVTPVVAEAMHRGIPGSELALFERSSHLAFWEERPRYFATLGDFLARHA